MAIIKKFRRIGSNSWGIAIPNEVFSLLNINPQETKFFFSQDCNSILINFIKQGKKNINEKKFVKTSTQWGVILPNVAFEMLEVKPEVDKAEISISVDIIRIRGHNDNKTES